jgi:hypothetical protein
MTSEEYTWDFRSGRDTDGSAYSSHILVHGSGRILAKVVAINYFHRAQFHFTAPKDVLDVDECFDFMDADSAKRFIEASLKTFDPLAPKKPASEEKKQPSNIPA